MHVKRSEQSTECTRDPIFLFQRKDWVDVEIDEEYGEPKEDSTLAWVTERVFMSRAEGEAYGKEREYDYPDGWRVYCVPCEGQLARLLTKYGDEEL